MQSYEEQEVCHICKKKFCLDENEDDEKFKKYQKLKDHCHCTGKFRGTALCNLRYKVQKNIPIVIHNAGYNTNFVMERLAEDFKGQFHCVEENMEKYITFAVLIKKKM